ncbi:MAG TPA: hypothetical protein DCW68_00550 [Rhodospirillaceae bacterium]|nr:hypothetical protein [Rhodospirillaceae bacterium]
MSNLIVTVIAIALVGIMTLAAVYYGGSAWMQSQSQADAGTISNEAMQIEGAVSVFHGEIGRYPSDVSELVERDYLSSGSEMQGWMFTQEAALALIGTDLRAQKACLEARKKQGLDAEANCEGVMEAGCAPSTTEAPSNCNPHCLRTCYIPGGAAPRSVINPQMDPHDVCCINNAEIEMVDPVFLP